MLDRLRPSGRTTERGLRLFACACLRRAWDVLPDERSREAVLTAERLADGLAGGPERKAARRAAEAAVEDARRDWLLLLNGWERLREPPPDSDDVWAAETRVRAAEAAAGAVRRGGLWEVAADALTTASRLRQGEAKPLSRLIGDVFRNRFRPPPALAPSLLDWNDSTIRKLAQAAYDDRLLPSGHLDPARLAVLADALEEAGCSDAELLTHLRTAGPHVRGCHALDALLGRS
jgi:hypothetical protein